MADLDDFELKDEAGGDPEGFDSFPPPKRSHLGIVVAGVALVAALGATAYLLTRPPAAPFPTPAPLATPAADVTTPSPGPTEAAGLPPLAQSDAWARNLVAGLSSHPQVAAWLEARGLVRTFAAAVLNVADGRSPAVLVPFLAPKQKFIPLDKGGRLVADPASFHAYDTFTDAFTSLDTAAAATAYRTASPLLSAAYKELGYPDGDFSRTMERAIAHLLQAPLPDGEPELTKGSMGFRYVDPKLEGLSLAQKQLLRMGPANARRIQDKLRALYRELGFTPHA